MVVPVGAILAYSAEKAPDGCLKCNGDLFDKTRYPLLAKLHPSGRTPDLRGEFIRGWDGGRGIDLGRKILTEQAATLLRTATLDYYNQDGNGAMGAVGIGFKHEDSLSKVWQKDFRMSDGSNPDNHPGSFADNGMTAIR